MVSYTTINCNGRLVSLDTPVVMGIINITTDSFYKNSRLQNERSVLDQVEKMVSEGAGLIDIGVMSSRPGAAIISAEEEWARLDRKSTRLNSSHVARSYAVFCLY